MNNSNEQPEIFKIRRKTPRARGLSWGGTIFFGIGLLTSGWYWLVSQGYLGISEVTSIRFAIFIVLFFLCAIILWVASSNAQNGTITIYDDRISCNCERTFLDIMPDQISSVNRDGNIVEIVFRGKTLTISSEEAPQIEDRVKELIISYKNSDNKLNTASDQTSKMKVESKDEQISAEKIREYRQLVYDGIITQEQFDQIINKLTKEV